MAGGSIKSWAIRVGLPGLISVGGVTAGLATGHPEIAAAVTATANVAAASYSWGVYDRPTATEPTRVADRVSVIESTEFEPPDATARMDVASEALTSSNSRDAGQAKTADGGAATQDAPKQGPEQESAGVWADSDHSASHKVTVRESAESGPASDQVNDARTTSSDERPSTQHPPLRTENVPRDEGSTPLGESVASPKEGEPASFGPDATTDGASYAVADQGAYTDSIPSSDGTTVPAHAEATPLAKEPATDDDAPSVDDAPPPVDEAPPKEDTPPPTEEAPVTEGPDEHARPHTSM